MRVTLYSLALLLTLILAPTPHAKGANPAFIIPIKASPYHCRVREASLCQKQSAGRCLRVSASREAQLTRSIARSPARSQRLRELKRQLSMLRRSKAECQSLFERTVQCHNGIQDGTERGIDCDGSCATRCSPEATPTTPATGTPPTVEPTATPAITITPQPSPTPRVYPRAAALSQYGVTWSFDRPYRYGQFVTGDWWVIPDSSTEGVVVTAISPDGETGRHGFQVNPVNLQALDSRGHDYRPELRPTLPLQISVDASIIKAVSKGTSTQCSYNAWESCVLSTVAILTVLREPPPDDAFRPPYWGSSKPIYRSISIDATRLPSVGTVQSPPSLVTLAAQFARPQFDPPGWWNRSIHPELNLPNYGGDIGRRSSEAVVRLMLSDSPGEKRPLLLNLVQYGIDIAAFIRTGNYFPSSGGHGNGRKIVMALAALFLDDQQLIDLVSVREVVKFSEDGGFIIGAGDVPIFGHDQSTSLEATYWNIVVDYNAAGSRVVADPYRYIDGGHRPLTSYQQLCFGPEKGAALSLILFPELRQVWNNDDFIRYVDRMVSVGGWAQPDPCAPATGSCASGSNIGGHCTSASPSSVCGEGVACNLVARLATDYGQLYGPNGQGGCILDTDPSDGIGRFPQLHGSNRDVMGYGSGFVNSVWSAYRE